MKRIVILEDNFSTKGSLADMCSRWPDNLKIFSASEKKVGEELVREKNPELIICNISSGYGPQLGTLSHFACTFPYIPIIAIVSVEQEIFDKALERGATFCMMAPVAPVDLRLQVHRLLEQSTSGLMKEISVHALLQMLETENKNCTLVVQKNSKVGRIFLEDGNVVGAEAEELLNEEALYSIVTWDNAQIEIKHYNRQRPREIDQPLISLIMEAFRLKDEKENLEQQFTEQESPKPKPKLKHASTPGNRISLEMGATIRLKFEGREAQLMSTMVGMIPNDVVVLTYPEPRDIAAELLKKNTRIVIKYLHMGRLCTFNTWLKGTVSSPVNIIFIEYPSVVHSQEMRRAKRTSVFVPSTLLFDKLKIQGVLIDLSSRGCLFRTKISKNRQIPRLDIDSNIQLECLLPGAGNTQILHGIVKNIKKSKNELLAGIEFQSISKNLRDTIEYYIQSVDMLNKE